jgi:hypothetical protein
MMLPDYTVIRNLDRQFGKGDQGRIFRGKRSHSGELPVRVENSCLGRHDFSILPGEPTEPILQHRIQPRERISHKANERIGHRTAAMRRRHENDANDTRVPLKSQDSIQFLDDLSIAFDLSRRDAKDAAPESILA